MFNAKALIICQNNSAYKFYYFIEGINNTLPYEVGFDFYASVSATNKSAHTGGCHTPPY